ncbi:FtsX-like permease family protein [Litoribacter ruber]|uniref:FtsX-like permease family protein n=1 Tax=Litoribacter ruber TaxID=702568 RepID=A0AAP2CII5_9BACT|nr:MULTISPECIES: FtsX-like permease family protein [Litoribacter]MBS9524304.1 FtsX-like permease family protein [Litoribacter alkaliphilus]MBT0809896.1 FtsX-like permease family protein [Litoribacter ruber]
MYNFKWTLLMAYRDFRQNKSKLALFISSIVIGIAALVGISTFGDNLSKDIDGQAKELLGADAVLSTNQPLGDQPLDTIATQKSTEINFASMVIFPETGESRLTQIRALDGQYPYYGKFETTPIEADSVFRSGGREALVEKILLAQFNAEVGDSIQVGEVTFRIAGELEGVPGQTGITATVAPAVYIPMGFAEETGLIQVGSRLNYVNYYQLEAENLDEVLKPYEEEWEIDNVRLETVESRKASTGRAFANLSSFLSLVAFIALLLGSVGVASAVNVFVKEKLASVAVLRCLGVSSRQAFVIYLTQIMLMGLVGSILGAVLGSFLQIALPNVFSDFLPVEVSTDVSWKAVGFGLGTGLLIALLFALLPLLKIRKVSPMMTLRPDDGESNKFSADPFRWLVMFGIVLFIFSFSFYLLSGWKEALGFTGFVLFAFAALWGVGTGIMWLIRRFLPLSLSYPIRQSLANLYRPNNQTISLIATVGLGTAMISTLFFVQNQLLEEAKFADKEDQPNMLMFDIQTQQLEAVSQKVTDKGYPIMQQVPIVTMRLSEINGKTKKDNENLVEDDRLSRSLYNREFRVTYRDTLIDSERLVEGKLRTYNSPQDSIFVSFDAGYAGRTGINLGDEIVFNVQGRPIKTYVGSFRNVKFNQVSTNFLVLFPENVLDNAPKFHVIITKTGSDRESANLQAEVVRAFPNISVINLGTITETLENILGKISFVIQFMALFSIATGFLVLISSLILSKYQRMKESVLLRTIGASSKTVGKINTMEYFFLGTLASLSGILLSFLATWLLSRFVFELPFRGAYEEAVLVYIGITLLTIVLGWLNGRKINNQPPMVILREG